MHVLLKLIKPRLHSHLADSNLEHLMKVAIEGPPLKDVDFIGILNFDLNNSWGRKYPRGDIPGLPSLYEPLVTMYSIILNMYSECRPTIYTI